MGRNIDNRLARLESIAPKEQRKNSHVLTLQAKIQAMAEREQGEPVGTVNDVITGLLASPCPARRRIGQIIDNARKRRETQL